MTEKELEKIKKELSGLPLALGKLKTFRTTVLMSLMLLLKMAYIFVKLYMKCRV